MDSLLYFLLSLIPVVLYCLVFAWINSRERGMLVHGTWDFVGVLLAASGFLILAGPNILAGIFDRYQLASARGGMRVNEGTTYFIWTGLKLLYFSLVVLGTYLIIHRRSRITTAYNVDPDAFTRELMSLFDQQGLSWVRSENTFHVKNATTRQVSANGATSTTAETVFSAAHSSGQEASVGQSDTHQSSSAPRQASAATSSNAHLFDETSAADSIQIHLETSKAMRNVTLTWSPAKSSLRQQIENDLTRLRSRFVPRHNPAGFWLLCVACLMILAIFAAGAVIVIATLAR
jgi:hypothetical protein